MFLTDRRMSDETDTSLLPRVHPAVSLLTFFFNQGQTLMYPFTFNQPSRPLLLLLLLLKHHLSACFSSSQPPTSTPLCNLKIYGSYRHCDSALMYCVYVTGRRPLPTAAVPTVPSDCAVGAKPACLPAAENSL